MPEKLTIKLTPIPPGWNYGEIVAYFNNRFDEDSPNVRLIIKQVLNEIMARHDWKWLHQADVITTQANLAEYPLAADCMQIDTEYMTIESVTQRVEKRPLSYVRRCQAKRGSMVGTPEIFADTGNNNVIFFPTPGEVLEIVYDYTKHATDTIEDDLVPPIPRHFQHVLFSGVEEIMRMDDDRIDGATNLARRKLEKQILDMIWREEQGEMHRMVPDMEPPDVQQWG
jgi:hypothetical protein